MTSLSDYLDLTVEQARSQWGRILKRQPKKRQEPFTPVEAILCYGLFFVVDPHKYGGSTMGAAPTIVHDLADLFVRPPRSITSKMLNLDGTWTHGGKHEWQFFIEMAVDRGRFPVLYGRVLLAARDMGIGSNRLPDFVPADGAGDFDLLGQEELSPRTFEIVVAVQAAQHRVRELAGEHATTRLVEQSMRLGSTDSQGRCLRTTTTPARFAASLPRRCPVIGSWWPHTSNLGPNATTESGSM